MQPIELPMMASGTMPRASRSRSAPTWWAPRAAPPPRMKTRFCRLAIADAPSYIGRGHACNPDLPRARRRRAPMLMLIDYSSLLFRSFHTIPESVPMHAVYGFLNMLARLVTDRRPDRLGIAVDEDWRPAFRVEALPAYKAHRVSDEPDPIAPEEAFGREVLEALGVAVVGAEGFEAEDVIATLAARAREPVEIVSGDRDLFALVRDPDVRVLYPLVGVTKLLHVDEAEITRRYGIPGRAYGDFALLRGDPSDGLPGVPG